MRTDQTSEMSRMNGWTGDIRIGLKLEWGGMTEEMDLGFTGPQTLRRIL